MTPPFPPHRFQGSGSVVCCLVATGISAGALALGRPATPVKRAWARRILRRLRIEVETFGILQPWPQIWIANHLSWLDPIIFMDLGGPDALAKAEVSRYPILGAAARRAGIPFVDRRSPGGRSRALADMVEGLACGRSYLVFPEGTTTSGATLAPLRVGALRTAYRLRIPVQAVRLDSPDPHYSWTGDAYLLPHLHRLASARRTKVRLQARGVLFPGDAPSESAWLAQLRHAIEP